MSKRHVPTEAQTEPTTDALTAANLDLDALTASLTHDLRAPLRAMTCFTEIVLQEHGDALGVEGRRRLAIVGDSGRQMAEMVDALVAFLRVGRAPFAKASLDPAEHATAAFEQLAAMRCGRPIELRLGALPRCDADPRLLRQVYFQLLANALEFTRGRDPAVIEVGCTGNGETVYYVRDNGEGFDMDHADRLFELFTSLHSPLQHRGTGAGLAIVQRAIARHGGRVWADAQPDGGATFYFTLADERGRTGHAPDHGGRD